VGNAPGGSIPRGWKAITYVGIEWVRRIGKAVGWLGEVLAAPREGIPAPYRFGQNLGSSAAPLDRDAS
jgi:hypothetical protein